MRGAGEGRARTDGERREQRVAKPRTEGERRGEVRTADRDVNERQKWEGKVNCRLIKEGEARSSYRGRRGEVQTNWGGRGEEQPD
ncbi:hypothetical protein Sjap_001237 [Stephania japonica]|uniref:Uncharacterized protein n=1 Tax=Stephania japonica TaxID=461633 RepID=A0AAP0PRH1_9MAGN